MKLFMFYVGGTFGNANVELHDVRFSIGETVEACHPDLRRQWWGDPASLHLDCWGHLLQADGFDIELVTTPKETHDQRLFFVNLGGYNAEDFAELHKNVLVVAVDASAAKRRALALIQDWSLPHKDNLFEVEKLVDLSEAMAGYGYRLSLTRATADRPFEFICTYLPIASPED